jgi:hypothetical protein
MGIEMNDIVWKRCENLEDKSICSNQVNERNPNEGSISSKNKSSRSSGEYL